MEQIPSSKFQVLNSNCSRRGAGRSRNFRWHYL